MNHNGPSVLEGTERVDGIIESLNSALGLMNAKVDDTGRMDLIQVHYEIAQE